MKYASISAIFCGFFLHFSSKWIVLGDNLTQKRNINYNFLEESHV